ANFPLPSPACGSWAGWATACQRRAESPPAAAVPSAAGVATGRPAESRARGPDPPAPRAVGDDPRSGAVAAPSRGLFGDPARCVPGTGVAERGGAASRHAGAGGDPGARAAADRGPAAPDRYRADPVARRIAACRVAGAGHLRVRRGWVRALQPAVPPAPPANRPPLAPSPTG